MELMCGGTGTALVLHAATKVDTNALKAVVNQFCDPPFAHSMHLN